jgi:hypothetical protein
MLAGKAQAEDTGSIPVLFEPWPEYLRREIRRCTADREYGRKQNQNRLYSKIQR